MKLLNTLQELGIFESNNPTEKWTTKLVNRQLLFANILHFIFLPLFFYLGVWYVSWVLLLGFSLSLVCLYLAYLGKSREALLSLVTFYGPAILASAYWVKGDAGIEYMVMASVTIPLFYIDKNNKTLVFISYIILFGCLLSFPILDVTHKGIYYITPSYLKIIRILCITSFFGFTLIQLRHLVMQLRKMYKEERILNESFVKNSRFSELSFIAAGVAHEVNNPLMIIQGSARIINKEVGESSSKRVKDSLNSIDDSCIRISEIVKGLKGFSIDLEAKNLGEYDLKNIVDDVIYLIKDKLDSQEIVLKSIGPIKKVPILADSQKLRYAIMSLVNNSFEAILRCDPNSPGTKNWISLEIRITDGFAFLYISDSGPGIPSDDLEKIMNPFFTTKTAGKGAGLGLSIAKEIIKEHSGTLEFIEDRPNTTFKISLPLFTDKG